MFLNLTVDHVLFIINRPMFVYKEGHASQNLGNFSKCFVIHCS